MFNAPNTYFMSSLSSSAMIFNQNTRNHPYNRIPTSCYPLDNNHSTGNDNEASLTRPPGAPRVFKRRVSGNKKERRRTLSINTAFSNLRTAIPNVQPDTKLSKIKTLKLATKYIEFLMDILAQDNPTAMPNTFKADIIKTLKFDTRKTRGRTGWPRAVWQSELNHP